QPDGGGGHQFLAQQRSAQALDEIERPQFHLVGAVDGERDAAVVRQRGERNSESAGQSGGLFGSGDAGDAQPLGDAPRQRSHRERRRGAAAEAHRHAVLDQRRGGFGGGQFPRVRFR